MPTFIKPGFWEKRQKGYDHWLNLDQLITTLLPAPITKTFYNKIQASYSGTTLETIIGTPILIPANTIKQNDIVQVAGIFQKAGISGNWNIQIYISPEANIQSGQVIYSPIDNVGNASNNNIYSHNFETPPYICKDGDLIGSTIGGTFDSSNYSLNSTYGQPASILFDPTVDNYLFATGILSSASDSIIQHLLQIKIY